MENISIDYGIMEKIEKAIVLKGTFPWDDVGGWLTLEKLHQHDEQGNIAKAPFQAVDTENCIIISDTHLVGTIGIKDLIIVATDDAILICHKNRSEEIKKLVEKLKTDPKLDKYLE